MRRCGLLMKYKLPNASMYIPFNFKGEEKFATRPTCWCAIIVLVLMIAYVWYSIVSIGNIQSLLPQVVNYMNNEELIN